MDGSGGGTADLARLIAVGLGIRRVGEPDLVGAGDFLGMAAGGFVIFVGL